MAKSHHENEMDELKSLNQEAAERRTERKRSRTSGRQKTEAESPQEAVSESNDLVAEEELSSEETDEAISGIAARIEEFVMELEEAASERPAVPVLAAFTLGIVIGSLFSRR